MSGLNVYNKVLQHDPVASMCTIPGGSWQISSSFAHATLGKQAGDGAILCLFARCLSKRTGKPSSMTEFQLAFVLPLNWAPAWSAVPTQLRKSNEKIGPRDVGRSATGACLHVHPCAHPSLLVLLQVACHKVACHAWQASGRSRQPAPSWQRRRQPSGPLGFCMWGAVRDHFASKLLIPKCVRIHQLTCSHISEQRAGAGTTAHATDFALLFSK